MERADGAAALEAGKRIRFMRQGRELTQGALAAKVFVTQPAVSQWERGETLPSRATQQAIAEALNTTRAFLFAEVVAAEQEVAA